MRLVSEKELGAVAGGEMEFFTIWESGGGGSARDYYGDYSGGGYVSPTYITESWHEYEDAQRFKSSDQIAADYNCDKGILGGLVAGSLGGLLSIAVGALGGSIANGCFD